MKCPSCGSEIKAGKRFCTNCGAPLGEPTSRMERVPPLPPAQGPAMRSTVPSPTTQMPLPPPPVGPDTAPAAGAAKPRGKRTAMVVAIVLIAILVVGGAAAGIVIWRVSEGNRLVAQIKGMELKNYDRSALDMKDVPLDKDLLLEVNYMARFKEGGKGKLDIAVVDGKGEEIRGKSYNIKSSGQQQTQTDSYRMSWSEGETFKITARLNVSKGGKSQKDVRSIEYYVAAGKGEKAQFNEARAEAVKKLAEATTAVKELAALGIKSDDLTSLLLDATNKLQEATTADQAKAVTATADQVMQECANRKAAQQTQAQAREACQANQAQIKRMLQAYYDQEGNFPNSMSDLGSLPACPSGGTYSYQADLTRDPPGLTVYCTVHGSL